MIAGKLSRAQKGDVVEPDGDNTVLQCAVRYTDQNPKGTSLSFGGAGVVSFHPDRIELTGVVTHRGAGSAVGEVVSAFTPLASAASILKKSRLRPERVVLPLSRLESLVFDPYRGCFAAIGVFPGAAAGMQRRSWPFRLGRASGVAAHDLALELRSLYPDAYLEARLPFENRRLLALFTVLIALLGIGALLHVFVFPALGIGRHRMLRKAGGVCATADVTIQPARAIGRGQQVSGRDDG